MTRFFEKRSGRSPKIYAYTELSDNHKGLIKIGYTERVVQDRMKEHYPTEGPENIKRYKILFERSSMREDGTYFRDHEIHKVLSHAGFERVGGEWFKCSIDNLQSAFISVKERKDIQIERSYNFSMRPEQENAVNITSRYFKNYMQSDDKAPHFLWNAKMRFGKTFTSYKLAKEMGWTKLLILTFKPAVESSWKFDLLSHTDFVDWQFITNKDKNFSVIDSTKPFVCFGSFQDFLGRNKFGGIKIKNKWAHGVDWDCIILDEYHFGAWRDTAKELYASEDIIEQKNEMGAIADWNEEISPLNTSHYLYLSGTPFKAIESGEFIEDQIYNWTYTDEQSSKHKWSGPNNPYSSLPRLVMMTYQMPESISQITDSGEYDEFNLNEFFQASGIGNEAKFKNQDYVQQWLNMIRGADFKNIYTNLKLGGKKPVLPFSDVRLLSELTHTLWYLPSISSCHAMKNLMLLQQNIFYHDYEIIVCAGKDAGIGVDAIIPVRKAMSDPMKTKTITLSCGKLTTGVTVKPWTGCFMLRNTSSPETYFQTAFRVQSPWTIPIEDKPNDDDILKKDCYVFDFAPNRALRLVTEYACKLEIDDDGQAESKVSEFIKYLPVICFDGSSMRELNAAEVLDYSIAGTTGSLLARKFESARLIHVDDITLKRLFENKDAMSALMKIEGFRNLNKDLETIINKSEKINDLKTRSTDNDLSNKERKELSDAEKEYKSMRKQYQEKLQKFATRIPVFMYLTDYREQTLKDVIINIEPALFKKVTSLSVKEFELLLSLGLFNSTLMNDAVFSFKRYENSSLQYDGYSKHEELDKSIGLFDTKITRDEFFEN